MLNLVCTNGVELASTAYFENRRCKSKTLWLLTFIGNWSNFEMKRFRFYNRSFVGLWSFHSTQSLSVPVGTACGWFCDDEKMCAVFGIYDICTPLSDWMVHLFLAKELKFANETENTQISQGRWRLFQSFSYYFWKTCHSLAV